MRSHPHFRATAPVQRAGLSASYDGREGYFSKVRTGQGYLSTSRTMDDVDPSSTSFSLLSWTPSRTSRPEVPSDNWGLLREMVERDGDEVNIGRRDESAVSPRSASSLLSMDSAHSSSTARPFAIRSDSHNAIEDSITGTLSSSPPAIPVTETAHEQQGILRGGSDPAERGRPVQAESQSLLDRTRSASRMPKPHGELTAYPALTTGSTSAATSWHPSPAVIAISKCCLAYFLASLFTFIPALARILSTRTEQDAHGRIHPRPAYSAHMVATIVVYVRSPLQIMADIVSSRQIRRKHASSG